MNKGNWGAVLLTPLWAFAHKLNIWAMLCFVPILNIAVAIYLGWKGTKIAYEKSLVEQESDFLKLQKHWSKRGIWVSLIVSFAGLFIPLHLFYYLPLMSLIPMIQWLMK